MTIEKPKRLFNYDARPPKLTSFSRRLLSTWKKLKLPLADASIVVAVSGGADSVALLLAIRELVVSQKLNVKVIVAHVDHGLRKESRTDAYWVKSLARSLDCVSVVTRVDVNKLIRKSGDNLEQAARVARYDSLSKSAAKHKAHHVLTAHTMDDQAETILLRLLRGSGGDGIAGMEPTRKLNDKSDTVLARPLLGWARRSDTEEFCRLRKMEFLSDPMNKDEQFTRVRIRRQLLPLMESFNARVVEALTRTAGLWRDELEVLSKEAAALLRKATVATNQSETNPPSLDVRVLAKAPVALRRRALRQWIANGRGDLRRCDMVHIAAVEKLLSGEQGGRIAELPGGTKVVRRQSRLELVIKP